MSEAPEISWSNRAIDSDQSLVFQTRKPFLFCRLALDPTLAQSLHALD
jgi:hypothetical protein